MPKLEVWASFRKAGMLYCMKYSAYIEYKE